jgi:NADH-quinone oxidoreductase subunit L/multicomponent Na+:H+ antiporter subunit D
MKITLFFAAGLVYVETGVKRLRDLPGIARRLPLTMAAFAVAAAGLAGFPLVAGFVSKWHLVLGAIETVGVAGAAVFLAAGLLKLLLFWPVVSAAFFGSERGAAAGRDSGAVADGGDGGGPPDARGRDTAHASDEDAAHVHRGAARHAHDQEEAVTGTGSRWDARSPLTETTPALLLPVLAAVGGALLLGIAPDAFPLWALAEAVVEEVFA